MIFTDQLNINITGRLVSTKGKTAQFTAIASGINRNNFRYQWGKRSSNNLPEKVSGVNGTTLTIPNVTKPDQGQYYCTVTNEWNRSVESNDGTLIVSGMLIVMTNIQLCASNLKRHKCIIYMTGKYTKAVDLSSPPCSTNY